MNITIESGVSIVMHKDYDREKHPAHACKESYYMANLNVWRKK